MVKADVAEFYNSLQSPAFWNKRLGHAPDRAPRRVHSVQMCLLTDDMVRKLAVCEVKQPSMYDKNIPRPNSINDLRMGTVDSSLACMTCKNYILDCTGHSGVIELVKPVFHTFFMSVVVKILRSVCHNCKKLIVHPDDAFMRRVSKLPAKQRFHAVTAHTKNKRSCSNCLHVMPTIKQCGFVIKKEWPVRREPRKRQKRGAAADEPRTGAWTAKEDMYAPLTPETARALLRSVSPDTYRLMGLNPDLSHPASFIIQALYVPPVDIRPSVTFDGSARQKGHDDLTRKLHEIEKINLKLAKEIASGDAAKWQPLFDQLQMQVATYMNNDSSQNKSSMSKKRSGQPEKSLARRLKGKRGRWRGNCMGKRVNNCSRSPITPDPNIGVDQLGVPLSIATSLTYPVIANQYNLRDLQQRVNVGHGKLGGASTVKLYKGDTIDLQSARKPPIVTVGSTVLRYLIDGDYVLFNRQPTLRDKSIMAHRVKIMPHSSFRLNLSTTKCYNADFDGDEMNMHVPQTVEAAYEARELLAIKKQILNAQNSQPCMCLVQDALVGAHCISRDDVFLTREQFFDLMMTLESMPADIPIPAILKPKPMWTGKQAMSLILPRVTLVTKDIHIRDGHLLSGVLTKKHLGDTAGGIIHQTCKLLDEDAAIKFMNECQYLCNRFLESEGFSIGISDCLVDDATNSKVQEAVQKCVAYATNIEHLAKELTVPFQHKEQSMQRTLGQVLGICGNIISDAMKPHNAFKLMVASGSKGSLINVAQVAGCVGQQSVEGKRILKKHYPNHRTLPHFPHGCNSVRSRGFVFKSYIRGIDPLDTFFHVEHGSVRVELCNICAREGREGGGGGERERGERESFVCRCAGLCVVCFCLFGEGGRGGGWQSLRVGAAMVVATDQVAWRGAWSFFFLESLQIKSKESKLNFCQMGCSDSKATHVIKQNTCEVRKFGQTWSNSKDKDMNKKLEDLAAASCNAIKDTTECNAVVVSAFDSKSKTVGIAEYVCQKVLTPPPKPEEGKTQGRARGQRVR